MHKKNFQITDKETSKTYWIGPNIVVLSKVIVTEEPNGPASRTLTSKEDILPNEKITATNSFYTSFDDNGLPDGKATIVYDVVNSNYVLNKYVVVNKRGQGCPSERGKWNIPVGYKDFGETMAETASREILEENKVYVAPGKFSIMEVVDSEHRNNVVVRMRADITMREYLEGVSIAATMDCSGGEANEVDEAILMPLTQDEINKREWGFNHKELLEYELLPVTYIL